ncbi:phospholipase D-like domain-containing protein [Gracilimonas sediminicola]|uniref:Phosphatidylserine/phosphatidylglycerophosphate/ cardiolipin synthase family protein n=1 Tax=Gracilimonas sediminicola TaxID=2952158 RepID=A0A9X2RD56_9BACT|nr:phosphatidylserine/phosphatidylglycerophosphate/cardiolipin synthase family protein [Gracilimonas sediminicola]MCP9291161.1 phosphatidylserine/phosphatidylglycerophosphate/cardiolipin synthase family protein [Gracilimonas sediminicola]
MCKNYAASEIRVFMDSDHFFEQLTADVQNARHSVSIQCMSFEADQVGTKLIELLGSKPTLERTLLIDDYSRFVVNDTFLNAPQGWMNKNNARKERQALDGLLKQARQSGIRVKFTNPMGFLMHRYPARNHKKMVLVDEEISYLGGMNFTEHNFEWSDTMVRHTNPDIAAALKVSFQADLNETTPPPITEINPKTVLYLLNGWKTKEAYTNLLERVTSSSKVVALSPYISYPMLDAIASVPDNQVILPKANNKPLMHYIHNLKRYSEINFKYVSGKMVHAKMLILDDEVAVYGSSNFDVISYFFEKEVVIVNKNPELIKQLTSFTSQLINK